MIKPEDRAALKDWEAFKRNIAQATSINMDESVKDKRERIESLLSNWQLFCDYYFPHYASKGYGKFHKRLATQLINNERITAVCPWSRDHAKSKQKKFAMLF
jgi:hypothetical protein